MIEYPVFVPFGDVQIAAVVAVPDAEPRGVVVFATGGGGVGRSHRYGLWTKAARGLADRQIASVRFDWPGVGDSTGRARFDLDAPPVDEALTVVRFAMDATGARRLGMVGNCIGARTSLEVASRLEACEGLVVFLLKPLSTAGQRHAVAATSKSIAVRLPKPMRRVVGRIGRAALSASGREGSLKRKLRALRGSTDVLIMEPAAGVAGGLARFAASLRGEYAGRRMEFKVLPSTTMQGFSTPERQEFLVGSVVEWFDDLFPTRFSAHLSQAEA